jgi:hypothetical protein
LTEKFGPRGGLVGGTAGYNYQLGRWVLGLEGDIDWAHLNGSSDPSAVAGGPVAYSTDLLWLNTVRGRTGYAFDRFLPYTTTGLAVGDVRGSIATPASVTTAPKCAPDGPLELVLSMASRGISVPRPNISTLGSERQRLCLWTTFVSAPTYYVLASTGASTDVECVLLLFLTTWPPRRGQPAGKHVFALLASSCLIMNASRFSDRLQ